MTTPEEGAHTPVDPAHNVLLGLHFTAGTFGDKRPGQDTFGPERTGDALTELAATPPEDVSFGARLDVLHALAKADFPDYDKHEAAYIALADSIGAPNGLDAQTVLDDVKASAGGDTPFAATRTAAKLPHSATAFVGEEICNMARVVVDGKAATWIFSEFETDAPFAQLARWVDPRNWPDNAPMMFKRMEPHRWGDHRADRAGGARALARRIPRGGAAGPAAQDPPPLRLLRRPGDGGRHDLRPHVQRRGPDHRRPWLPAGIRHRRRGPPGERL